MTWLSISVLISGFDMAAAAAPIRAPGSITTKLQENLSPSMNKVIDWISTVCMVTGHIWYSSGEYLSDSRMVR